MAISRFTLAVDREGKKDGGQTADFINCVAFGKKGEFASNYLRKGTKILYVGHWQTGSYTNKDGAKVYTNDCVADKIEFAESKGSNSTSQNGGASNANDGFTNIPPEMDLPFMNIPENIESDLPFPSPSR